MLKISVHNRGEKQNRWRKINYALKALATYKLVELNIKNYLQERWKNQANNNILSALKSWLEKLILPLQHDPKVAWILHG